MINTQQGLQETWNSWPSILYVYREITWEQTNQGAEPLAWLSSAWLIFFLLHLTELADVSFSCLFTVYMKSTVGTHVTFYEFQVNSALMDLIKATKSAMKPEEWSAQPENTSGKLKKTKHLRFLFKANCSGANLLCCILIRNRGTHFCETHYRHDANRWRCKCRRSNL